MTTSLERLHRKYRRKRHGNILRPKRNRTDSLTQTHLDKANKMKARIQKLLDDPFMKESCNQSMDEQLWIQYANGWCELIQYDMNHRGKLDVWRDVEPRPGMGTPWDETQRHYCNFLSSQFELRFHYSENPTRVVIFNDWLHWTSLIVHERWHNGLKSRCELTNAERDDIANEIFSHLFVLNILENKPLENDERIDMLEKWRKSFTEPNSKFLTIEMRKMKHPGLDFNVNDLFIHWVLDNKSVLGLSDDDPIIKRCKEFAGIYDATLNDILLDDILPDQLPTPKHNPVIPPVIPLKINSIHLARSL